MIHNAGKHIGDRFDTPMRMHGKSFDVIVRIAGSEMIKK